MENGTVELARRDTLTKEVVSLNDLNVKVEVLLKEIQEALFKKACFIFDVNRFQMVQTL